MSDRRTGARAIAWPPPVAYSVNIREVFTLSTFESKKNYHHGDLREALLTAALATLEENGVAALSLRETARRAGVSAMAPYRHFADKDALLVGVATIGFDRLARDLLAADANPDPKEALVAQGVTYVAFAVANPALFRLMFGTTLLKQPTPSAVVGINAYEVLAKRVASLVAPEEAADWTLACWSMVHGMAALVLDGRVPLDSKTVPMVANRILRFLSITS